MLILTLCCTIHFWTSSFLIGTFIPKRIFWGYSIMRDCLIISYVKFTDTCSLDFSRETYLTPKLIFFFKFSFMIRIFFYGESLEKKEKEDKAALMWSSMRLISLRYVSENFIFLPIRVISISWSPADASEGNTLPDFRDTIFKQRFLSKSMRINTFDDEYSFEGISLSIVAQNISFLSLLQIN